LQSAAKIDSSEFTDLNRVIGWFITLRWIACAGVAATLLVIRLRLLYRLPFELLFAITALLALLNLSFMLYFRWARKGNLSRREMVVFFHVQIICDYVLLAFLVYFTGFLENPFAYFFVFHIMLTAFIFSPRVVFVYVGALVALLAGLFVAEYAGLIPHFPLFGDGFDSYLRRFMPRALALAGTLVISAYLITDIKRRIAEKGRRVEVELDRYKNLDRLKSNFILQVTHELRGPIAAMNGYHEMILRGVGGESNSKTVDIIRKANRRTENLLTIIDEMIDFAYMNSDQELRYSRTELHVKELIDANLELASSQAEQKTISLLGNCPRELKILSNRDLLNIILTNLISNALRYSPSGSTVTVNAQEEGSDVHIMVKDEGYGIEPEEMEKIFEEFYRSRRARELERDGTGLGLPIVKRAVESLAGRITVYSEPGKGTTFHIFIPQTEVKHEQDPDHR
jgi:signal transduction histidine kinase